jgi:AraC-like DNA-binding protein
LVDKVLTRLAEFYTNHDMTQEHHVAATYLRLLAEYLNQRQLDPQVVLGTAAAQILHAHQAHPSGSQGTVAMVTRGQFCALLGQIQAVCAEPALAIQLAQKISAAHLGVLGYLLLACANLAEALIKMDRYARLIYDGHQMQVLAQDDQITLVWNMPMAVGDERIFAELGMAVVVQFARNLTGLDSATMTEVAFKHASDAPLDEYLAFFGCPVRFDQAQTQLVFPACLLALPLRQPDAMLLSILESQATQALDLLPKTDAFVREVQRQIIRLCHDGAPTLAQVADQLCLSPRTLQRRLADQGTRFQPVLDETRQQLCAQYLADQRLQLTDIAQLLGYSDQSAFTRAYRRWTGGTPHDARYVSVGRA